MSVRMNNACCGSRGSLREESMDDGRWRGMMSLEESELVRPNLSVLCLY